MKKNLFVLGLVAACVAAYCGLCDYAEAKCDADVLAQHASLYRTASKKAGQSCTVSRECEGLLICWNGGQADTPSRCH